MNGYASIEAARVAAAEDYVPAALYGYREVGWVITEYVDSSGVKMYAYTYPTPTVPGDTMGAVAFIEKVEKNNPGHTVVERGHNHFTSERRFSAADSRRVTTNVPFVLYNINGEASILDYNLVRRHASDGAKRALNNYIPGKPVPSSNINTTYK